ncbi:class I SAM-dependent methyltransferase [Luteitalea sp.]|jgi:ubiquinone/menaquinone biosynthesis C-methylase UbiE|uniref:class I SAM-dependent methyltransferase n=1 Tax=Luteitalea sp. TaxID=2004800 RepID=UPI0037C6B1FD
MPAGHEGWGAYAPFYDWENARTMGRRDLTFWRHLAAQVAGPVVELGSGTGRLTVPLHRQGIPIVGVDYTAEMLRRVAPRARRSRTTRPRIVRADASRLPLADEAFRLVMAPYGFLQSLLSDAMLARTIREAYRVLAPGGLIGVDLVPDVPKWRQYTRKVVFFSPEGPRGLPITLRETVRQDREKRLTTFEQEYIEGRGAAKQVTPFTIRFRTLPLPAVARRLERAGFEVEAILGDYRGGAWDPRADVWLLLARKPSR